MLTNTYRYYQPNPVAAKTRDCVIRAISAVLGISWDEAFDLLAERAKQMGATMDDLISRAAAIDYLMTNMGWRDEDGYEIDDADEKQAIITDLVNGIPAVDAIPVEWLERRREGLIYAAMNGLQVYGNNVIELCNAINMVLDMWQKEQEAR